MGTDSRHREKAAHEVADEEPEASRAGHRASRAAKPGSGSGAFGSMGQGYAFAVADGEDDYDDDYEDDAEMPAGVFSAMQARGEHGRGANSAGVLEGLGVDPRLGGGDKASGHGVGIGFHVGENGDSGQESSASELWIRCENVLGAQLT